VVRFERRYRRRDHTADDELPYVTYREEHASKTLRPWRRFGWPLLWCFCLRGYRSIGLPRYSYATNYISELGVPGSSQLAVVMNLGFWLQGILFLSGQCSQLGQCDGSPPVVHCPCSDVCTGRRSGGDVSGNSAATGNYNAGYASLAGLTAGHPRRERGDHRRILRRCRIGEDAMVTAQFPVSLPSSDS